MRGYAELHVGLIHEKKSNKSYLLDNDKLAPWVGIENKEDVHDVLMNEVGWSTTS